MVDNNNKPLPKDNMRTLFYFMHEQFDLRIQHLRRGTEFEHVRVSDVRTFIYASAGNQSINDLAKALGVTRQAVHMSLKRLMEIDVLKMVPEANSRRDMVIVLTERGQRAKQQAHLTIFKFEEEIASVVGSDGLEQLRALLKTVLLNAQAKNMAAGLSFKPPA
jgi:DNA-binding MarR family transcriptional regulator